jgi:hypothetical protein
MYWARIAEDIDLKSNSLYQYLIHSILLLKWYLVGYISHFKKETMPHLISLSAFWAFCQTVSSVLTGFSHQYNW